MVGLMNDARLKAGKSPLGFLNPLLYQMAKERPQAFNDVTVGTNKDGDLQSANSPFPAFCPYGFEARPGYDPVTGLGTPNFEEMLDYVMSLQ
jgi:tripeptidyl-peptidase I